MGFETAKILLESGQGYHILLGSRSLNKGDEAVRALRASTHASNKLTPIQIDVTSEQSIQNAVKSVEALAGRLDCLVNNAGRMSHVSPVTTALKETFEVNVIGPVAVTEAFKSLLIKSSDPRLLFVTSSLGSLVGASNPQSPYFQSVTGHQWLEYRMSKAALNMAMITYSKTLAEHGVKVWAADPGPNQTGLLGSVREEIIQKIGREVMDRVPHPSKGGKVLAGCVQGERDNESGKIVGSYGVGEW